jgi:hypothetical protein
MGVRVGRLRRVTGNGHLILALESGQLKGAVGRDIRACALPGRMYKGDPPGRKRLSLVGHGPRNGGRGQPDSAVTGAVGSLTLPSPQPNAAVRTGIVNKRQQLVLPFMIHLGWLAIGRTDFLIRPWSKFRRPAHGVRRPRSAGRIGKSVLRNCTGSLSKGFRGMTVVPVGQVLENLQVNAVADKMRPAVAQHHVDAARMAAL